MSSPDELLKTGTEAVQQGRYADAIDHLEAFCRQHPTQDKSYFQAQMWLVRAYHETGQSHHAIALCQYLANTGNAHLKAWVDRILPTLSRSSPIPSSSGKGGEHPSSSSNPLSAGSLKSLLEGGHQALKSRRYTEAIEALQTFCQETPITEKTFAQAQMWLVKAYEGNQQRDEAIALCEQLTQHWDPIVQTWAQNYVLTLDPSRAPKPEPRRELEPHSVPEPHDRPISSSALATQSDPWKHTPVTSRAGGSRSENRQTLSILCHGSMLINFVIGFGFIIPLVILLTARDRVVEQNSKEALNLHLSLFLIGLLLALLAYPFGFIIAIIFMGIPFLGILLIIILILWSLFMVFVQPIMGMIHCSQRPDQPFTYIWIWHIIR